MTVETPVTLEVSDLNRDVLTAKQNDIDSRYIRVTLTDAGSPVSIPVGSVVAIEFKRPDATSSKAIGIVNEDGTATVPIPSVALELAGIVTATITVSEGGVRLSSCNFRIVVESDPSRATPTPTPGGTTDYNQLTNKPSINGQELVGNVTLPTESNVREIVSDVVPAWAREPSKPSYNAREVGAATIGDVRDEIRENVPDWAREASKPTYTSSEVGAASSESVEELVQDVADVAEAVVSVDEDVTVLKEHTRLEMPPLIAFVDDDGTKSVLGLHDWMIQNNVPYTLAVSTGYIGDAEGRHLSWEDMRTLNADPLVSFSCHSTGDRVMSDYTAEEVEADIKLWRNDMVDHGLPGDVPTIMYNHGTVVDAYIDSVISKYFRYGFTVRKGVNTLPFNNYKMFRVGLFPSDESFTLDDAKSYVDLVRDGGLLVFFTHCYYDTFSFEELTELVRYIRECGIEIEGLNNVVDRYRAFLGEDENAGDWQDIAVEITNSRSIGSATSSKPGQVITDSSASNCVTNAVPVASGSRILVGGTAYSLKGMVAFYDPEGKPIRCYWQEDSKSGDNAKFSFEVEVPQGAVSVVVAGNSTRQLPYVKKWIPAGSGVTEDRVTEMIGNAESRLSESITDIEQRLSALEDVDAIADDVLATQTDLLGVI